MHLDIRDIAFFVGITIYFLSALWLLFNSSECFDTGPDNYIDWEELRYGNKRNNESLLGSSGCERSSDSEGKGS